MPFEVPDNWVWTTLGYIGVWQAGGTPSRSNKSYYGGNIPWLKTGDLNDGLITNIPESITEEAVANSSAKINPTGSVLIAMYGATIGKLGILTFPATTNQACCACVEYFAITQYYLFYFLLSHRDVFIAKGGGGAQPNISKEIIVNTAIPLPPLAEQERIVTEIERWFALIDQIEQSQSDLQIVIKHTKSKILDLAIHGKLVPQDPNDEPASELLKRINPKAEITCDNGHYPFVIPSTWIWHKIGTVAQVITGSTPSKSIPDYYGGSFPFYKPSDLDAGRHVVQSSEYLSEKGKSVSKIIPSNSIAICCIGSIGKIGYIEKEGTTNQQINTILPRKTILNPLYCYYVCSSSFFVSQLIDLSSAITISIVNKSRLQSTDIPLPPISEQQRIVAKIEELFSVLDDIQKSLEA